MDAADIERLYRAHGPGLLRYLGRQFVRVAAPEDLLQETFMQALRRPDDLAHAASPRAWLFGIARNVALVAARNRRPTAPLPHPANLAAPASAPDDRLADMHQAIAVLPDHLRETLSLRLGDALTYEEIAMVLDIPVGTVRSRIHAALRQLRDQLAADVPARNRTPEEAQP